ncbi:hypothetical protein KPL42_01525 [Clostridium gasigenes]|uniref:BRO family protein n=1 Tax=Clostridium gasigenes TaxID=94869 RepID=UPI001C0CC9B7|nr:hypothetical protein [Clostridium gasigenes]
MNLTNLFRLIVKSKLPYSEKFEKWVFEDILPTIRSKGLSPISFKLSKMASITPLIFPSNCPSSFPSCL